MVWREEIKAATGFMATVSCSLAHVEEGFDGSTGLLSDRSLLMVPSLGEILKKTNSEYLVAAKQLESFCFCDSSSPRAQPISGSPA